MSRDMGNMNRSGFINFSPSDEGLLSDLQKKYSKDYLPFISTLIDTAGPGPTKTKNLMDLEEKIIEVIQDIGKILSGRLTRETGQKLLLVLFEKMDIVNRGFEDVSRLMGTRSPINAAIKKTESKTGVKFKELVSKYREINSGIQGTVSPETPDLLSSLKEAAPQGYAAGKDMTLGLANAALGPFAEMAKLGVGTGTSVFKALQSYVKSRQTAKLTESLIPSMGGEGFGTVSGTGGTPVGLPSSLGRSSTSASREGEKLSGKQLENASSPLTYFFDKVAYKTSWTAGVFNMLKKLTDSGGASPVGGAGAFGSFGGTLAGNILSKVLPVAGVAGLGALTVALGVLANKMDKQLHEKNKGASQALDLAKVSALPGMSLINPIQGPKLMGEAYAKLTKDVMGVVNPWIDKNIKQQLSGLSSLTSQFSVLNKALKPFGERLVSLVDLMGRTFDGVVNMIPKSIRDKIFPVISPDMGRPVVQKGKEVQTNKIIENNQSVVMGTKFDKMAAGLDQVNKALAEQARKQMQPSSTVSPDTSDVHYGQRDTLIDGLGAGRYDLNND
jgi:hypothetical protein